MRNADPRDAPEITLLEESIYASDLASTLGAELVGPNTQIVGVGTYGSRVPQSLSYQGNAPEREGDVERTVICRRETVDSISASTKIITKDPRQAFMRFLAKAKPDWTRTANLQAEKMGVSSGHHDAHRSALIEDGTVIAKGVVIEPNAVILQGSIIGEDTIIASGSIIGAHGPAIYRCEDGTVLSWAKIHFGTVQIGSHCEIGFQAVVLRAMLGRTRICNNVILGNVVHVGHGVHIGERVWMAARVTVCGHAFIDSEVSIGAGATIRDNVYIGTGASIGMGSAVVASIAPGKCVLGVPAKETDKPFHSGPTRGGAPP